MHVCFYIKMVLTLKKNSYNLRKSVVLMQLNYKHIIFQYDAVNLKHTSELFSYSHRSFQFLFFNLLNA